MEAVKPVEAERPVEPVKTATTAQLAPAEGTANAVAGKSGVGGVVAFEGTVPAPRKLDMSKDKACVKLSPNAEIRDVEAKDGKLKNVLVYVKSGLAPDAKPEVSTEAATLDQKGCMYEPRVLGVQVGQPLVILNSDPLLHNVHAFAKAGEFNQAMPKPGKIEKKLKKPQVPIAVKCEVHPWMEAHVGAFDHPYFAVTDAEGKFEIAGLPAGEYELEMWHATLGTQNAKVSIKVGAGSNVNATFKAAK